MNSLQQYYNERGILIAAHRGTNGGNIIQNTTKAYMNALFHKADMIEVDVVRSKDGKFFAFHDGQEPLVFGKKIDIRELSAKEILSMTCYNSLNEPVDQKLESIEFILDKFQGKALINIDRSWFYWDTFLDALKGYKSLEQVLLKSPPKIELLEQLLNAQLDVMYMPIIKTVEELEQVMQFEGLNIAAVEMVFTSLDSDLLNPEIMKALHNKNILVWVNALTLSDTHVLSAKIDDDTAILDNGQSWGKLVDMGFDIIQTDWPYPLYNYLIEKNYKK